MDLQLQNEFFKQFEKQVYYNRYFKELNCREDGRKFQQSRKSTIILNSLQTADGSCIFKKGKMLIICQVKASFQEIFINALSNKPQTPLLKVTVSLPDDRSLTNFQKSKKESFISYSIQLELNKLNIQKQLVSKHKHKSFGYRLSMDIRVLSEDGNVFEHCLMSAELGLQTTKLKTLNIEGDEIKEAQPNRVLNLQRFIVPTVMSEINKQIVVDPSLSEEKSSQYSITNWIDLIGTNHTITKIGSAQVELSVILKVQQEIQSQKKDMNSKLNLKSIISKLLSHPSSAIQLEVNI